MGGTVTIVYDEEHGRHWVSVRLESYYFTLTVDDEYVKLVAAAEKPSTKKAGRRKGALFNGAD